MKKDSVMTALATSAAATNGVPAPAGVRAGAFGNATHLVCRACGEKTSLGPFYACMECFGPLEVGYDFPRVTRADIESGPKSIWRYAPLLPVPSDIATFRSTDPGFTRLVDAGNLAADLGLRQLWVKDDSGNPTHSFKDRVVAVALSAARELGLNVLACPSTGNLANAVAAAAARAAIRSVVMIPSNLEQQKIIASAVYDTTLIAVEGTYDDVNKLASEIAAEEEGWAFVNVNVRPYYAEGSKTLAYEIAEQLDWTIPDRIVAPIASGSLFTKLKKGFGEWIDLGLIEGDIPTMNGAQATGCSPVATAYKAGHDVVRPVKPDTIAKSLAIGNPADGPYVLDVVRRTGGSIVDVDDATVVTNIQRLARTEGIFAETAGGVTVGCTARLIAEGLLDPSKETVVINSGDGLKTLDAVADRVGPKTTIPPRYEAFTEFWKARG